MTRDTFSTSMAFLQKYFGHVLDTTVVKMYWNMLKGLTDEEFRTSSQSLVISFRPTSQVPFPLVGDFLGGIGKTGEPAIQNGMARLDKAIRTVGAWGTVDLGDLALHAAVEQFGGWVKVASWTYEEWSFNRKALVEAYRGAMKSSRKGSVYLTGKTELQNANSGHLRDTVVHKVYTDFDGRLRIEQKDINLLESRKKCPECGADLDGNGKCIAQCGRYERIGHSEGFEQVDNQFGGNETSNENVSGQTDTVRVSENKG